MPSDVLKLGQRITAMPVIHGSGDFAVEVRRLMLSESFDCLAVPLPASFQKNVERAIDFLPGVTAVVQQEPSAIAARDWTPDAEDDSEPDETPAAASYVPIDPCQAVIAALRIAKGERIPCEFIDLETARFESYAAALPDPYALKKVSIERFAAAMLPGIPELPEGQPRERVVHMANRLRELEAKHQSVLFLCSILDWPWIREAYNEQHSPDAEHDDVEETEILACDPDTLTFLLGELPFITALYERARVELDDDENLSIDGVKEMLLAARDSYRNELKSRARKITPKLMSVFFQYARNLSLIERRLTPDLYTLVTAAQQIAGDQFAIFLTRTAREYAASGMLPFRKLKMGIGQARMPDGETVMMKNRLPGHPVTWRSLKLKPLPMKQQQMEWQMRWDPYRQCSWPPEDVNIEKFRTHVKDAALDLIGNDLARTEKFTTSLKDGLDIRETLRNWHTGELYVRLLPPTRGKLDCVVMLFDSPADPREYPWRITWHAESHDESTLTLFATDFRRELVGPGIGLSTYGGAMFLFPPRPISDVWRDPQFDFCDTLEERMIAGACRHSREKHIALMSAGAPGIGWKRLAKKYGKKLVHVPLSRFSQETIQQLRMFHVLNGQEIRSYASHFIRKA